MTQENKDLRLKDLCARLPYGVKVEIYKDEPPYKLKGYDGKDFLSDSGWDYLIEQCKPYLFPLSSMTEKQKKAAPFESSLLNAFINGYISLFEDEELTIDDLNRLFDWLNENHFDYRRLIEKGLAIDATELNIY